MTTLEEVFLRVGHQQHAASPASPKKRRLKDAKPEADQLDFGVEVKSANIVPKAQELETPIVFNTGAVLIRQQVRAQLTKRWQNAKRDRKVVMWVSDL